jgi:CheY-like chemotaxis protein
MLKARILLAEDDMDDRKLFLDYLEGREDISVVHIVENGIELFDYLGKIRKEEYPDLIILDQNMPKKNGLQTLTDLKANSTYSTIPVFVYSTYADHQLVTECSSRGALRVVSKPLSRNGYHIMMDEILQQLS